MYAFATPETARLIASMTAADDPAAPDRFPLAHKCGRRNQLRARCHNGVTASPLWHSTCCKKAYN
jgi:hypothetical protein